MTRIAVCALLFLLAGLALSQQQQPQNPGQNPPQASPQPSPDSQQPQQQSNPQDKSGVNSQIQSNVASALNSDPALSGTDVEVSVDDVSITLTGSVQSQAQLDRVMALVSPYQRYRSVINKVKVH